MPAIRAVFFSFFFHFLLITLVIWLAPKFESKPQETIEISLDDEAQILDALTPNKKQIVRQAVAPEQLKAPEDDNLARFLSEKKQRVRDETQAAANGMTANRSKQGGKSNREEARPDKDGYQPMDISQQLQEMNRFEHGTSSIGESMPHDVKVGSFTALNTDRYLYYTFYARMEELIRFRWETRVQHAINTLDRLTLASIGDRNWVTHVEFLLDRHGVLQKALIMKESGIRAFDSAAINAFRDARMFPNPPQEMLQEDGYIHIKFGFTVNYNPPALVNRN